MHIHFRVTVFPINELQKKRQIIRPRRGQSMFVDRYDLFFQLRPQFLFRESLLAAKFDHRCPTRLPFLRFLDLALSLLFFFGLGNIDSGLRGKVRGKHCAANKEKNLVPHLNETESDTSTFPESRRRLRDRQPPQTDR